MGVHYNVKQSKNHGAPITKFLGREQRRNEPGKVTWEGKGRGETRIENEDENEPGLSLKVEAAF